MPIINSAEYGQILKLKAKMKDDEKIIFYKAIPIIIKKTFLENFVDRIRRKKFFSLDNF